MILRLLILSLFFGLSTNSFAEKKAFIIAIGDYPSSSGWSDLSAENDVAYLEQALTGRGFKLENIQILKNQEATYQGILNKFSSFTKDLNKGDIVYLQFSGHGQQAQDNNGDEIDGLDEAFVPYDSPLKYGANQYEGKRLLRDDEIERKITAIRKKIGPEGQLIVVMDSCHSGTGIRGKAKSRGTNVIMAPENFKPLSKDIKYGIDNIDDENLAPFVAFFASGSNESNSEYLPTEQFFSKEKTDSAPRRVGSLSFAIAFTLCDINKALNVQELFDRIKLIMTRIAPNQHPQMEGNNEIFLFNTEKVTTEILYPFTKTKSPKTIRANFGILDNIPVSSKVEVISLDKDETIANGVVISSSLSFSEIRLKENLENIISKDELTKIKVIEKAVPKIQCTIKIDITDTNNWSELISKLKAQQNIMITNQEADLYISDCEDEGVVELRTKSGDLLCQSKKKKSTFYNFNLFLKKISDFNQCNFLRQYEVPSNEFKMTMELIPIKVKKVNGKLIETERLSLSQFKKQNNRLVFSEGDAIKIRVTNNSRKLLYYSVIDIQPDHKISLLIPNPLDRNTAADFSLEPGKSITIDIPFVFEFPYGTDILKLIATEEPLDLKFICDHRGVSDSEDESIHPFENLFSYSFQNEASRGEYTRQVVPSEIGITSLIYEIKKK